MRNRIIFLGFTMVMCGIVFTSTAQTILLKGSIVDSSHSVVLSGVVVKIENTALRTISASDGAFSIAVLPNKKYTLELRSTGYSTQFIHLITKNRDIDLGIVFLSHYVKELNEVIINSTTETFGITRLKSVEGGMLNDSKKNEVVLLKDLDLNLSTNSSRQIFAKVPGINVWESDPAGLQLGIAARGLDPNRTSSFNTRQNGYDMSADALGYPESYYVPPAEAVERIEILRGAASLQYGPQFGGMVNYVLNKAPKDKKIEWTSLITGNRFNIWSVYNSLGGTVKKFNYFGFYNYKQGNGWRPNTQFKVHSAYVNLGYNFSEKLQANIEYTFSTYLAQQPGGLTDAQFNTDPSQSLRSRNWFSTQWNILALKLNYKYNTFHQLDVRIWGFMGNRKALGLLDAPNRIDDMTKKRDLIYDDYLNVGAEARYVWKYFIKRQLSTLLVGGRFYKGQTLKQQGFGDNGKEARFSFNSERDISSSFKFPGLNGAFFAENAFAISPKLKLIPGVRLEYISTKSNGFFRQTSGETIDSISQAEQRGYNRFFYLLGGGLSYSFIENNELYANISQNYRGITFTDMRVIRNNQVIDPSLKDERGFNGDIGFRGSIQKFFQYDVSAFWLQYNNRIGQIQMVDNAFTIYRYTTNVGASRSVGVETYLELDILELARKSKRAGHLVLFSTLGFTDAIYTKSTFKSVVGKQLEFAPKFTLRAGITYRFKQFSTSFLANYTSLQYSDATNAVFAANAVNGQIPAYFVLDWNAKYSIKCFQIGVGVNNFTNQKYFTRRALSYPGPGIIPAEPLTFYISIGIKLNEKVKETKWITYN